MLSEKEQNQLKEKLLEMKEDLEDQLGGIADRQGGKGNYKTRFPNYGREDEDNAEEVEDYDRTLPVEQGLELELKKINEALTRIEQGKYGICEECGQEIGFERLKAYPHARKCMKCHGK